MNGVLSAEHLHARFGGLAVTRDVSLALAAGERTALIGPNGAGKTTLVNLLAGTMRSASGRVWLRGEDVTRLGTAGRVRRGLVRSFQVTRLFADMTPQEHLALSILQRERRTGRLFGSFETMPAVVREAAGILDVLGLAGVAERKVAAIAYGEQRLVEIALALALRPRVLLLDEPAAGVPRAETGRIERALAQLPPDLAVLMIEHDMDLVFRFARRVVVLAAGAIIFDGEPEAAARNPLVRQAYLGSYPHARRPA